MTGHPTRPLELYHLDEDWSQAHDLAAANPQKLEEMKALFLDSLVSMEVDAPANANGVLYALAGFSGGVTCYFKDGILSYEFNLFEITRTKIRATEKLPAGKARIEVEFNGSTKSAVR